MTFRKMLKLGLKNASIKYGVCHSVRGCPKSGYSIDYEGFNRVGVFWPCSMRTMLFYRPCQPVQAYLYSDWWSKRCSLPPGKPLDGPHWHYSQTFQLSPGGDPSVSVTSGELFYDPLGPHYYGVVRARICKISHLYSLHWIRWVYLICSFSKFHPSSPPTPQVASHVSLAYFSGPIATGFSCRGHLCISSEVR